MTITTTNAITKIRRRKNLATLYLADFSRADVALVGATNHAGHVAAHLDPVRLGGRHYLAKPTRGDKSTLADNHN